jgi:ubiquinone/menaquinone biosynthesis C-methylase UbiE
VARVSTEEEAALYDSVVVPRYNARFAQLLLRAIPKGQRARVVDLGCGTGQPAFSLLERLDVGARVIAIDQNPTLVELARRRAMTVSGSRIFFKVESAERLSFGAQVFDTAVGNLVFSDLERPEEALAEARRVLVPDGRLLLTRAMEGTFVEILDMFREVAIRHDLPDVTARTAEVARRYPSATAFANEVRAAGFEDVSVDVEPFRLSFRNARELFADPLFNFVGLAEWRWIAGFEKGRERLLEEIETSLDVYFAGGPLSLTVEAGLLEAHAP